MYVKDYLKMDELKNGYLYKIIARNASFGIWKEDIKGFIISRVKFGSNYLFEEHHYDHDKWPTAQPVEEIEKSPFDTSDINEKEALDYLNQFEENREWMWPRKKDTTTNKKNVKKPK